MSLYNTTIDFVKNATKNFDESHDYLHAKAVYSLSKEIMDSFNFKYDEDILILSALLHDVRDHKYENCISEGEFLDFIRTHAPNSVDIIVKIINNISYSKEAKGLREALDSPYCLYLDAISDADRIQALGKEGIRRCEVFTRARGGKVPEDVIQHCHDKLLKLLPEGYIRTDLGKDIAQGLHEEIQQYVNSYTLC